MRAAFWISALTAGLTACASSPSASSGAASPAPSGAGATATANTGAANPCATGTCRITIQIDPAVKDILMNERRMIFKAYKGCPTSLGGQTATALRGATPLYESSSQLLVLPAFEGKKVSLAFWMGPTPAELTVVDFGTNTDVVVKAPYVQGPAGYMTDDVIQREFGSAIRGCR